MSLDKKGAKEARECGLDVILKMSEEDFEKFNLEGLRVLRIYLSNRVASIERLTGRNEYSDEDSQLSDACETAMRKIDKIMDKLFINKRR